jgi:hypothetical protein
MLAFLILADEKEREGKIRGNNHSPSTPTLRLHMLAGGEREKRKGKKESCPF